MAFTNAFDWKLACILLKQLTKKMFAMIMNSYPRALLSSVSLGSHDALETLWSPRPIGPSESPDASFSLSNTNSDVSNSVFIHAINNPKKLVIMESYRQR